MRSLKSFLTPRQKRDKLPHQVTNNRVYILPTKSGMLFCSMLFIMFLVSLNNNNNLGLLLTFFLSSMFLTSMIYAHSNLLGLKILSLTAKPVFSGETLEISCSVFSPKITRPLVTANLPGQNKTSTAIKEASNQQIIVKAVELKRGKYQPETIILETEFPFSFFRAWTYLKTDLECIIYPKPIANSYQGSALDESTESLLQNKAEKGSDDFDGLKTYQAGDPLKQIYWKGFARGGGLHSKTYSGGKGEVLLFDFDAIETTDLEKRLSILSQKVSEINKLGSRFALQLPNKLIGPSSGEAHTNSCLEALALFGEKNA